MYHNTLQVWVLLKGEREVEGTLLGFDVFLNLVLGDVVDYCVTEKGTVATRMGDILLNGTLPDASREPSQCWALTRERCTHRAAG